MAGTPTRHRHRGLTLALVACGLGLGCAPERSDERGEPSASELVDASSSDSGSAPELRSPALFGCLGIVAIPSGPPRCLLRKPKRLSVWLSDPSPSKTIEARFDGAPVEVEVSHEHDGILVHVEPARTSGRLEIHAASGEVWAVELVPLSQRDAELRRAARERLRAGEPAAALDLLDAGIPTLEPDEAALLRCEAARAGMAAQRFDRVLATVDAVASTRAVSCVGGAHLLAAYVQLFDQPDFNAAEQHLAQAERLATLDLEVRIGVAYLRGVLDHRLGRLDESLVGFETAVRLAALVGDEAQLASALVMQAVTLARLGRLDEAEALAREVEAQVGTLGTDAGLEPVALDIRYNLAWIGLLRREADRTAPDPSGTLSELLGRYAKAGSPADLARTRLHLALASIQSGALASARDQLAQLEPSQLDPHSLVWRELIEAELQLHEGHPGRARRQLERAMLYAELSEDRELAWRVWAAKGSFARRSGDEQEALLAFRRARELADELALAVPGSSGRSMLATIHSRPDAELVDLLLALDQSREAICVAVGVRARHLRGLWARLRPPLGPDDQRAYQDLLSRHQARRASIDERLEHAWMLPEAELARLRDGLRSEGEQADALLDRATALLERDAPRWSCEQVEPEQADHAVLVTTPSAGGDRWWFLLWRASGDIDAVSVDAALAPEARFERALLELEPALASIGRLELIPVGELVTVDAHALVRARPSLAGLSVVYSLGLGDPSLADSAAPERRASVVAGASNLDAVAEEVRLVGAELVERGFVVEPSWAPSSDDQPVLLHYAGHGHHAGLAGWDSHIDVPGSGQLSAAQIVAGQRAPRVVVLGACSTGTVDAEVIDGGMNLAAAFLLAGAELVIAPTGPVDDRAALELSRGLYSKLHGDDPRALIDALASVQRAAPSQDAGPGSFVRWRAWQP